MAKSYTQEEALQLIQEGKWQKVIDNYQHYVFPPRRTFRFIPDEEPVEQTEIDPAIQKSVEAILEALQKQFPDNKKR